MKIFSTPIEEKKEFTFDGDTLKQCEHNTTTGLWLYERYYKDGRLKGYEVVMGVKTKQPDGTIVEVYPSSEQFGTKGLYYPSRTNRESLVKSLEIPMSRETREERIACVKYDYYFDKRGNKILA